MDEAVLNSIERPVGEVVEASTTGFLAQCRRLYEAPPLGSLVKSEGDGPVYGVVADVATQSIDPSRHPVAMGEEDETAEAVYSRNPQLSQLLSTEFRCAAVGYRAGERLHRYLAPLPPKIHSSIYLCGPDETRELCASLDFLPMLLASPVGSPDDVITSFLRLACRRHPEPSQFLVRAGKEIATSLGGEMQRLNGLLRRLSQ